MTKLEIPETEVIDALASQLTQPNGKPDNNQLPKVFMRDAQIYSIESSSATIYFAGSTQNIPGVKWLGSVTNLFQNQVVKVLQYKADNEQTNYLIIGAVNTVPSTVGQYLAYEYMNASTPSGKYVGASGLSQTMTVNTTSTGTGLWFVNVPVTPGRLLSFSWQIWAYQPAATSTQEYVFEYLVAINGGGTYTKIGERRAAPIAYGGSLLGDIPYIVPAGVTQVSFALNVLLSTGTGGINRWGGTPSNQFSWAKLRDEGVVNTY